MQAFRVLFITLMTLWAVACSSAEEAPKAKSTSSGEVLSADGGSGSTPTPAAKTEQTTATTPKDEAKVSEEEEEEEEDGDDGEDGEDEDDDGNGSALTFTSSHRDDNDYSIAVKAGGKDWQRKEWPNQGESIQFAGLCKGTKLTIQVKVIHEDGKEITSGSQLKVEANGTTAKVAFEEASEEGEGGGEGSPDDLVGELSCSKTKLSVK